MGTLRPPRGKEATAVSKNLVLEKGAIFFEIPTGGVGTGYGNIKMGDGSTAYSDLPYFIKDNSSQVANIIDGTTTVKKATTATQAGKASSATSATYASTSTQAGTATYASKATSATSAVYSSTATYAKTAPNYKGATTAAAGTAGFVPAASTANCTKFLRGDGTWATPSSASSASYATNAGTSSYSSNSAKATSATSATYASTANYAKNAGTASYATNAGKATQLKTARKINGVSFNGTDDITISDRRYAFSGSDAVNTAGWYKVATGDIYTNCDTVAIFSITSTFSRHASGILHLHLRANSDGISTNGAALRWLSRNGFDVGDVIVVVNGSSWYMYINNTVGQWSRVMVEILNDSSRVDTLSGINLVSSTAPESTAPTPSIVASDSGILSGTSAPASSLGNNGDIYLQYE